MSMPHWLAWTLVAIIIILYMVGKESDV